MHGYVGRGARGTTVAGRLLRLREGPVVRAVEKEASAGAAEVRHRGASRGLPELLALNLVVMLGYGLTGLVVAQFFAAFGRLPSPIWLPAGIALAAALLGRASVAPGLFAGSVAVNAILFQAPLWVTLAISLTNTVGPLLGARVMRRAAPPDQTFASLRGLAGFIVGGIGLHAAVTGAGGTLALLLIRHLSLDHAATAWASWWLSDAGGVLYLAPTLVLWLGHAAVPGPARGFEEKAMWVATTLAAGLLFGTGAALDPVMAPLPYLLALPLAWATLRWSLRSAATLFTLVMVIATVGTVAGVGPFIRLGLHDPLTGLGGLVVLCGVNMLLTGVLANERRAAALRLAEANRALEERVRQRTRELETAHAVAEAASDAKSRFLGVVSHELRTPLTGVLGCADLLLTSPLTAEQRRLVETQIGSGQALLRTIEAMLAVSQRETGATSAPASGFVPRDLLTACLEAIAAGARKRGLTPSVAVGPAVPARLVGDGERIGEILRELLANAVRFAVPGELRLTLVSLGAAGDRHRLRFGVEDGGPGIAPADQARLFQPFGLLDDSSTRRHGGAGLGLARCRRLAETMGGRIGLDSAPGTGSRFWLELELSAA
jgi:two-component system cell cycle sensor histidine kinase PleC